MLRDYSQQIHSTLKHADVLAATAVFGGLASIPQVVPSAGLGLQSGIGMLGLGLATALVWPILLRQLGVYRAQDLSSLPGAIPQIAAAGGLVASVQLGLGLAHLAPMSPEFALACGSTQALAMLLLRLVLFAGHEWLHPQGRLVRHVLIVGSGPRAAEVAESIESNPDARLRVLGFLDTGEPPDGRRIPREQVFKFCDVQGLINDQVVDEIIIACPRSMLGSIVEVVDASAAAGVPITLLSDLFGDYLPAPRAIRFGSLPALSFAQVHHHPLLLITKRLNDIMGSALLLLATAPAIVSAAALIKLTSKGPVFYRQVRCGLHGRPFTMHKLRTMSADADDQREALLARNEMDGPVFKIRRDPRVTSVGRFLRRTSFDELPQLWNVLVGDMSLVGPRPPLPVEVAEYQTFQQRRLSMRPGLTCIWQVSGRNSIGFDDWVRLDLQYIDTWSLRQDLLILFRTLPAVLRGDGAS